jgi:predicted negative regulator of RcsB-dependent stress response
MCNLASALKETNRPAEAIACYEKALAIDPRLVAAHFGLGVIYQAKEQFDKAQAAYRRTVALKPDHAAAHNNLGTIYRNQGQLAEAIRSFERTLEFHPDSGEALSNLGNVFMVQGRRTEAMICYDQALRAAPHYAQAHTNRALARLASGHFIDGWPEYEWRWQCPDFTPHGHREPLWDGSPLGSRTLLVHAEQGLGDTLLFARYVPLVEAQQGRVVFEVQKQLVPLLKQSGVPGVVARGEPLPTCDLQIPLLSMPLAFGTKYDAVPCDVPYLSADPRLVDHWRTILADNDKFKVAIAWQGSVTYRSDRFRSIPLQQFAPLAIDGVQLISVQRGPGSEQIGELEHSFPVRTLGESFDRDHGAFMDTAAVFKNVDLVITSDTSVAHLAGALGVPTWVALPIGPDWRWHIDRDDSPWYPTMRLFRQTTFNEWPEVFQRIANALQEIAATNKQTNPKR